jgi:succinate dehydrogenase/fumarate reductase flavoprotein subunit
VSYGSDLIEMSISEIGLCSGHSASGVWVNERGETTVPGLYAAGDMASVPHGYMLGAFTYGKICGRNAVESISSLKDSRLDDVQIKAEHRRVLRPMSQLDGIPPHQFEYKLRRRVNDYLQPPKSAYRLEKGLEFFERAREDLEQLGATDPHELMRANEAHFIRDCAEMAARASLLRTESRWGLYHHRLDFPEMDDANWFVHVNLKKGADGAMNLFRRPVEAYVVSLDAEELRSYHRLRIESLAA